MTPILDPEAQRDHAWRNLAHTGLLLGGIGLLLAVSSAMIWGWIGVICTLAAVAILFLTSPRIPPEMVMRLYSAVPVDATRGGQLYDLIQAVSSRAGLERQPQLYVIPSMTLNAFAAGNRDHAAIGITEGLLRRLSLREIAAVLAHEVSHIRNNDLQVMGLADLMSRFTLALSYTGVLLAVLNLFEMMTLGEARVPWVGIALLYLAPTISSLLQLGLSRAREYDADLGSVRLTGDPAGLISALHKLERYTGRFWEDLMFPVPGRRVPQPSVLRSHPSTEDRIARLADLAPTANTPPLVIVERPIVSLVGFGPMSMRPRYRFPGMWY
ncbi:MAG: M48 family metalloprotease [Hyphomicrobiaceae bacterium]|nr:M48 family metalloprotease [Hyphomicrobiaceae bacterium]